MRLLEFFKPFHVVITRRVTEEEQVSVETFAADRATAEAHLHAFLEVFRNHRRVTNEQVIEATRQQRLALDGQIENRGEELRQLDNELDKRRQELKGIDAVLKQKKERAGLSGLTSA